MGARSPLDVRTLGVPAVDISQTDLYHSMRAEAAKLDSASTQIDWMQVRTQSRRVLEELGQDLLAAAYWAHAQHMCAGVQALAQSLDVVSCLLEEAWPHMSPPQARIKGRAGAVEWLVLHTTHALQVLRPGAADLDVAALAAAAKRLQTTAQWRLEDRAPGFAKLRSAIEQLVAPPPPPPALAGAPLAASAGSPTLGAAPVRASAARTPSMPEANGPPSLSSLGEMLSLHAISLRQHAPYSPRAMRLMRAGLWLHIDAPPVHTNQLTRIPALPQSVRALMAEHKAHKRWQNLLDEAERRVVQHRMHLDLQCDAALALRQLGPNFAACLTAVEDEVRAFVQRVPELLQLQAADKTPLADATTQAWVRSLLRLQGAGDVAPVYGAAPPCCSAPAADDASQHGARGRFEARLKQAESALQSTQTAIALALFRGLYRQLCRKQLLTWDSALSLRVLTGFWRCLQNNSQQTALTAAVFEKIARLSPDTAILLS